MEDEQSFGYRRRFCVWMKAGLTLEPVVTRCNPCENAAAQVCTDLGDAALKSDIRRIGLPEFF